MNDRQKENAIAAEEKNKEAGIGTRWQDMRIKIILVSLVIIIQMVCMATAQSDTYTISGTWDIIGNGYHGTMILDSGRIKMDTAPEEVLTDIRFDGNNIQFTRISRVCQDCDQNYIGEVSGDTMKGSFTQKNLPGGTFQWSATRINGLQVQPTENRPPTVTMSYSPGNPTDQDLIEFGADGNDPDGDALTYSWFVNDEQQYETMSTMSMKLSPGSYAITVKVSDGKGGTAEESVNFEVTKPLQSDELKVAIDEGAIGPNSCLLTTTVLAVGSEEPIANALIEYRIWHTQKGDYQDSPGVPTDASGKSYLTVPQGTWRVDVYASKEGYGGEAWTNIYDCCGTEG